MGDMQQVSRAVDEDPYQLLQVDNRANVACEVGESLPEVNFIAPEPDELEAEMIRFKEWVDRIRRYGR